MFILILLILILFILICKILNKKFYILAGCKRVLTVDGRKLENCIGISEGSTIFGNNFDLINLSPGGYT